MTEGLELLYLIHWDLLHPLLTLVDLQLLCLSCCCLLRHAGWAPWHQKGQLDCLETHLLLLAG